MEPLARIVKIPTRTPTAEPTPVPPPSPTPNPHEAETISFSQSPGNIYINFADGSGTYRLEVLDSDGRHVKTLFEKHVVAQKDEWAEWDGNDEQGTPVPLGRYTVVLSKGGNVLNTIFMIKTKDGL